MTDDRRPLDGFFGVMSRRAVLLFLAAVFCVFAPLGVLASSSIVQERPPWLVLALFCLSGVIAVCWAGLFTLSRWFVAGVVLTSLMMAALSSWASKYDPNPSLRGRATLWIAVLLTVAGYALFVAFISGQGRTTLRLMTEMALARGIHRMLVPPIDLRHESFEALGTSVASSEMGGDLIDAVRGDGHVDLFLVDVSGHGVKAGVVMGMIKAAMRTVLRRGEGLDVTLSEVNAVLDDITSPELYATAVGLRLDGGGRLAYTFAGHHHAVLWRAAARRIERLHARAAPLGLIGAQSYRIEEIDFAPGDLLAVYTDGLNETMDADDRELGHEPIERRVGELAGRPLGEIQAALFDLAAAHGPRTDDQTVLLVRRFPPRP
jgi:hypothetical protein